MRCMNQDKMQQIAQDAFNKARGNARWQRAILRAMAELEANPFISWTGTALVIWSPSNEIYEAHGACQCKAYQKNQPCWHRAAARLVKRYAEASH